MANQNEQGAAVAEPEGLSETEAARQAMAKASKGRPLTSAEEDSALAWILEDEPAEPDVGRIELNVGRGGAERWITWTYHAISSDQIREFQRSSSSRKAQDDPTSANWKIVAAATVDPDLPKAAAAKGMALSITDPLWAPIQILKHRFSHKPGLVDQIAMKVLALSGYDDDDVRNVLEAGKS